MGRLLTSGPLTFNGGASTADQFSPTLDFSSTSLASAAWLLKVTYTTPPLAITLQTNGDPTGSTLSGWNDVATADLKILNMSTSAYLPQVHASIQGGTIRGGVVNTSSGVAHLLFVWSPLFAFYRLGFQITAATVATVDHILASP